MGNVADGRIEASMEQRGLVYIRHSCGSLRYLVRGVESGKDLEE